MKRWTPRALAALSLSLPLPSTAAFAQEEPSNMQFTFDAAAEYQLSTELGTASGEFEVFRVRGGVGLATALTRNVDMKLNLSYAVDDYEFDDPGLSGVPDPWDDVHTITFSGHFSMEMSDEWTAFAGPIVRVSRESGAAWDDAITGGAYVGAYTRIGDDLTLGGGVGVMSDIENDVRMFPLIVLDWTITETLSLRNTAGGSGRAGVELVWEASDNWTFGLSLAYERTRFRLDESDTAHSEGVGENESLPLTVRATYELNANVSLTAYGGFVLDPNLRLEDEGGSRIADREGDPAPYLGLSASIRF